MATKGYACDGQVIKNFAIWEMANTQTKADIKLETNPMLLPFIIMVQLLREYYNKPLNINSWYREAEFNKSVKGDPKSPHLRGLAVDVAFPPLTSAQRMKLSEAWRRICGWYNTTFTPAFKKQMGWKDKVIGGVTWYEWGLHFDIDSDVAWGYKNFRITKNGL